MCLYFVITRVDMDLKDFSLKVPNSMLTVQNNDEDNRRSFESGGMKKVLNLSGFLWYIFHTPKISNLVINNNNNNNNINNYSSPLLFR